MLQVTNVKKRKAVKLRMMFVLLRGDQTRARSVGKSTLGVLELDGGVMNMILAEQIIDALEN